MRRLKTKDDIEFEKKANEYLKITRTCKCSARIVIEPWIDKKRLCEHCGRYVFLNKTDEFKYRLKEQMNRRNYVRENQNQMAR